LGKLSVDLLANFTEISNTCYYAIAVVFRDLDIVVVSAALGHQKYFLAAERLKKQLSGFFVDDQILILKPSTLSKYCPATSNLYSEYMTKETIGFGYWTWKSELVFSVLKNHSYVLYLDVGCEFNANYFSRLTFKRLLDETKKNGYLIQDTGIQEKIVTKKEVVDKLAVPERYLNTPQFSATWFLIQQTGGLNFVKEWLDLTLQGINLSDESTSIENSTGFFAHRNDQSLFSLTAKRLQLSASNFHPRGGEGNLNAYLLGYPVPIWPSRNISSESKIPRWYPFKYSS
jgi:hypothetical protein